MFVSERLYSRILRVMPIPCVDLLVVDDAGGVLLGPNRNIRLDHQSSEASWLTPRKWLDRGVHPFVCKRLEEIAKP